MKFCNIYLSGKMSGLSLEEQFKWRNQIINAIKYGDYEYEITPMFFSPPKYYSPSTYEHKSEREVFEYNINKLRKTDIVIANLNRNNSVGTIMEIAIAKELNIPIISICEDLSTLHPWLIECTTRMCDNLKETVEYVVNFYLN